MRIERIPFVVLALLALVLGLLAGLHRIGWTFPLAGVSSNHGAIMVGGFLGTLITLEKIIPLKRKSLYAIPVVSGASVLLFFFNLPTYAFPCLILASAALSMVFFIYLTRDVSLVYAMMFAGAVCWLVGNVLLRTQKFYPVALPWWMAFSLLIITAERIELMKFLPVSKLQKVMFILIQMIFLIGCLISFHGMGSYFAAFALMATAIWLLQHDVVGINLRRENLTKYVGVALLMGYISLLFCGVFLLLVSSQPLEYDILVHSFFIGFVFSIIFAHGPIILPGVLGLSVKPYRPILYFWLGLLHASWIARTLADVTLDMQLRKYSGLISAIAIIGYFISIVVSAFRLRKKTL